MTHPTDDHLRAALERIDQLARLVAHDLQGRVEAGKVAAVLQCADVARAALAAAPQPAPAAADERAEIERIICDAFTCDLRGRGDEDGAFWQTAADALLAAGYRKADRLAREAVLRAIEQGEAFTDTNPEERWIEDMKAGAYDTDWTLEEVSDIASDLAVEIMIAVGSDDPDWHGTIQTIIDRALRAILAELDALIHDIERAKASESSLLAELEEARA